MKNYLLPMAFLVTCMLIGCKDGDEDIQPYLSANVTGTSDTQGDPIVATIAFTPEELAQDPILQSTKIKKVTGDSIILKNGVSLINYAITSNSTWMISKFAGYGQKGSTTWVSTPDPATGGGDSRTTSNIKSNTSTSSRRMRLYICTGDSAIIYKVVLMQQDKNQKY